METQFSFLLYTIETMPEHQEVLNQPISLESLFPDAINVHIIDFTKESEFHDDATDRRCVIIATKKGHIGAYLHLPTMDTDPKKATRTTINKLIQFFSQYAGTERIAVCLAGGDDGIPLSMEHAIALQVALQANPSFIYDEKSTNIGGVLARNGTVKEDGLTIDQIASDHSSQEHGQVFLPFPIESSE